MINLDWKDLQYVIYVAKTGSLSAAARELGVTHTTVLRRISAFEQRTKVQIFEKDSKGYVLSHNGRSLLKDLEDVAPVMERINNRFGDFNTQLEGELSITTTNGLFNNFLKTSIFQFARFYPGIHLDLQISDELKNLGHLESDIAVRPFSSSMDGLFGAKIGEVRFHVYANRDIATNLNAESMFETTPWIGYSGSLTNSKIGQILTSKVSKAQYMISVNTLEAAALAIESGMGIGLIPEHLAASNQHLVKVSQGDPIFVNPIYVLARKELQSSRRINAFINFMQKKPMI